MSEFGWRVEVPLCLLGIVQGKASRCVGKSSLSVICGQVSVCIHNPRNVHERAGRRRERDRKGDCVCVPYLDIVTQHLFLLLFYSSSSSHFTSILLSIPVLLVDIQ